MQSVHTDTCGIERLGIIRIGQVYLLLRKAWCQMLPDRLLLGRQKAR